MKITIILTILGGTVGALITSAAIRYFHAEYIQCAILLGFAHFFRTLVGDMIRDITK